jgi:hypothetical protein
MFISGFEICDFNPMFSDVHNRINFSLHCDQKETITPGSVDTISGKPTLNGTTQRAQNVDR